jgi:hypothetical protein
MAAVRAVITPKSSDDPGSGDEVVKGQELVGVGQKGANCGNRGFLSSSLRTAGLAETKLAPTGNQIRPSWLLRLPSGLSQAGVRLASGQGHAPHLHLRLKQQLLGSKDGNGNCSCRDSDIEYPVSFHLGFDEHKRKSRKYKYQARARI